jgi:hypothetical protein
MWILRGGEQEAPHWRAAILLVAHEICTASLVALPSGI